MGEGFTIAPRVHDVYAGDDSNDVRGRNEASGLAPDPLDGMEVPLLAPGEDKTIKLKGRARPAASAKGGTRGAKDSRSASRSDAEDGARSGARSRAARSGSAGS